MKEKYIALFQRLAQAGLLDSKKVGEGTSQASKVRSQILGFARPFDGSYSAGAQYFALLENCQRFYSELNDETEEVAEIKRLLEEVLKVDHEASLYARLRQLSYGVLNTDKMVTFQIKAENQ